MDILRFLPKNEYDAAVNSNSPSAANPFATIADAGAQGLAANLVVENTTGANDIVFTAGQVSKSSIGDSFIDLHGANPLGNNDVNRLTISNSSTSTTRALLQLTPTGSFFFNSGNFGTGTHYSQYISNNTSFNLSLFNATGFTNWGRIGMEENNSGNVTVSNFGAAAYPVYASTEDIVINQGITNVFVTGKDIIAKSSDSLYLNQVAFNTGLAGEMKLVHTPNAGDFTATLQAASGTIAYLSDVSNVYVSNGTLTGNRTFDLDGNNLYFANGGGVGFIGIGASSPSGSEAFRVIGTSLIGGTIINNNGLYVDGGGSTNTTNFSVSNDADGQYFTVETGGGVGRVGIGVLPTIAAKLHIKGTSLLDSLLVQNSLSQNALRIDDNAEVYISTGDINVESSTKGIVLKDRLGGGNSARVFVQEDTPGNFTLYTEAV